MTEYVTMPDPEQPEKYILAERVVFSSLADFLHMDLFRGPVSYTHLDVYKRQPPWKTRQ